MGVTTAIFYPILCAAMFYLGSQAKITQALWSRYPPAIDAFMSCSACSGFWYGLGCALLGWWQNWPFLGLDGRDPLTAILIALAAVIWTPIIARYHTEALYVLGSPATYNGPPIEGPVEGDLTGQTIGGGDGGQEES